MKDDFIQSRITLPKLSEIIDKAQIQVQQAKFSVPRDVFSLVM